jgi:hypothetical protein
LFVALGSLPNAHQQSLSATLHRSSRVAPSKDPPGFAPVERLVDRIAHSGSSSASHAPVSGRWSLDVVSVRPSFRVKSTWSQSWAREWAIG